MPVLAALFVVYLALTHNAFDFSDDIASAFEAPRLVCKMRDASIQALG